MVGKVKKKKTRRSISISAETPAEKSARLAAGLAARTAGKQRTFGKKVRMKKRT